MARIPTDLQKGERIEITMKTGEIDVVRFQGWVWIKGLSPCLKFVIDSHLQQEDSHIEETVWMARSLIGYIRRLPEAK